MSIETSSKVGFSVGVVDHSQNMLAFVIVSDFKHKCVAVLKAMVWGVCLVEVIT